MVKMSKEIWAIVQHPSLTKIHACKDGCCFYTLLQGI